MMATNLDGSSGSGAAHLEGAYWRARLAALIGKHRVPGAALGVLRDGQIVDVAAGVLSKATMVEATPDSLFQIGSITKVWTATLVMQLIDEGTLSLETPVVEVLPDFAIADPDATKAVTVRHLLTHTSGIDGDVLVDTGRGDDCVESYVAHLRNAAQIHPVGATLSYCNSGFAVAGRIVEILTGTTWDAALRERITEPLRLAGTVTLPEDAILHRAAVGHVGKSGGDQVPTSVWMLPRGRGPAGRINARVHDVLEFARMHLAGGVFTDGVTVLSSRSAHAMADRHVGVPDTAMTGDSCGLGWMRFDWDGHRLIGHNGGTIGQYAFLRMLPDQNFAVALLTNGGDAVGLYRDVFSETFADLAGVNMPTAFGPPAEPVDTELSAYEGRYRRAGLTTDVVRGPGGLELKSTYTGLLPELLPGLSTQQPLIPVGKGRFATRPEGSRWWESVLFYTLPDGARYFHHQSRANPRVETSAGKNDEL